MSYLLYGSISKDNIEYEWKSEAGACEICKALNGTIYSSANDIPDKPHPNCKCWIDIREKKKEITDPIEARREIAKNKRRDELRLAKLLGDTLSLDDEIDEYIRIIDEQTTIIKNIKNYIKKNKKKKKKIQEIIKAKDELDYSKYKGIKLKRELFTIQEKVNQPDVAIKEISKLQFEMLRLKQYAEDLFSEAKLRIFTLGIDIIGTISQPDAEALWNISVDGLNPNNKYIKENGTIYDRLGDLRNIKLERLVQNKIQVQLGVNDSRGVVFHQNSSLSIAIQNSPEFKTLIKNNKNILLKNGNLENVSLEFIESNLKNALHNVDVIDTYVDSMGNLHTKILDTYDFNPNETDWKVKTARELQEKKKIQTYYTIIEIMIPENIWVNY